MICQLTTQVVYEETGLEQLVFDLSIFFVAEIWVKLSSEKKCVVFKGWWIKKDQFWNIFKEILPITCVILDDIAFTVKTWNIYT